MVKKKKIIHKIKWQKVALEGWTINYLSIKGKGGFKSLCCNSLVTAFHIKHVKWKRLPIYWGNGSIKWENVTCKNCLKKRDE
jgi:hypothetical protein